MKSEKFFEIYVFGNIVLFFLFYAFIGRIIGKALGSEQVVGFILSFLLILGLATQYKKIKKMFIK